MKKLRFVRFVLALLSLALMLQGQTIQYAYQTPLQIFTTVSTSGGFHIAVTAAAFHVLTWNNVGTVATCQIQADGSVDGSTWGSGDVIPSTLCTSSGTVTSSSHVVNFIRINVTAISGAGATVSARLTGYVTNPTGGGGGLADPGANGPIKRTALNVTAPATSADLIALWTGTCNVGTFLRGDGACAAVGTGTVTNTGGALTANALVLGAGGNDTKVSASLTTNGTAGLNIGSTGVGGTLTIFGATSGSNTVTSPATGVQLDLSATALNFNNGSGQLKSVGNLTLTTGATSILTIQGGAGSANATFVDIANGNMNATSGNQFNVNVRTPFIPTSGNAALINLMSQPTINQTSTASGTIRSLASYPVNTSVLGLEYLIAAGTASAIGAAGTLTDKFLVDSNGIVRMGNACSIISDITLTVNTNITICQFSLPAVSQAWGWTCNIPWVISAGTGTNTISIGVNASQTPVATTTASAQIYSTNTGTSTAATVNLSASGALNVLTSPTITPAATVFQSTTFGTLSSSATAGTFTITMNAAGTTATALAKAGASCRLF